MNLIKINNVDCFPGRNFKIQTFTDTDTNDCIKQLISMNINVFIVSNNTVYYRNNTIKDCVMNIIKKDNCDMYIYTDYKYYFNTKERLEIYTKGIQDITYINNEKKNLFNKNMIIEGIESNTLRELDLKFYKKILSYIKDYDSFSFYMNIYDIDWGCLFPTFTKCRPKNDIKKSILLPLEDLYIPNYHINILKDDIPFQTKIKSCIWRGSDSGPFYYDSKPDKFGIKRSSRKDLLVKYFDKYNIGLSSNQYKKNYHNFESKKYVKGPLSIKEHLKYMFIISVEGNDFATNLNWILLSNSVPLLAEPYIETWSLESKLVPFIHYVPLNTDFSDLDEKIEWCINNLEKCEDIVYNSKLFALQFFDIDKEYKLINSVINIYKNNIII